MTSAYYHNSKFNLYLASSQLPNAGLGVFTHDCIPPNVLIDEYTGNVCSSFIRGAYVLEVSSDCHIDAWPFPRCYMAILNDCAYVSKRTIKKKGRRIDITPDANYDINMKKLVHNCVFIFDTATNRAFVYSSAEIGCSEELFISYGEDYWTP
jgi:hypothetical protein